MSNYKFGFNQVAFISISALILVCIYVGCAYSWKFSELGPIGDYFGGLANAVALSLVAFGLVLQQKEYSLSIEELKQQTEIMQSSTETQLFNLLYSTLIQRSSDFSYTDSKGLNPASFQGIAVLEHLAERYLSNSSHANLKPLRDRRSVIDAFLRSYLQTLKYIRAISAEDRRRILAELVFHQFVGIVNSIVNIESGGGDKIGISETVLKELVDVMTQIHHTLSQSR